MKYNRFPKRDAIKNYFPLPNELFILGLNAGEISVCVRQVKMLAKGPQKG